jgi:Cof subfamily protein (haloacid dehalogenase superfamily)
MKVKLVASDLDGTIIDKNNNISAKNFDAIKKIHKKKIDFAICTGKAYSVSKKICDKFTATYGIFGNGTQIINLKTGQELLRRTLEKKDLLFIVTFAKRYNYHIHLYTETEIISEKLEYMDLRNYKLRNQNSTDGLKFKIIPDILEFIEKTDIEVFSAVISSSESNLTYFKSLLNINSNIETTFINKRGKYRDKIINKDYEYLNIAPNNINKNEALNFLSKHLNISKENMLAIGDNINDLEMVKNTGIGVAVNSAYDDLKKVAKYVTKTSVSDGAFAEAIDKFI